MQIFDPTSIQEIKELLSSPKKIAITSHRNPDGDAIGSSLALYNLLKQENHEIEVVMPTPYPRFLHWLPNNKVVINAIEHFERSKEALTNADIIFCLDYNGISRVDRLEETLKNAKGIKILIDHHPEPETFPNYVFSDTSSPATGQLLFEFMVEIGREKQIDADVATCLYTGILTDTGSFRFSSTTAKTHQIVARLIEHGAKNAEIYSKIHDSQTIDKLRFWGHSLKEKLVYLPELKTAFIYISNAELDTYNHQNGDAEGLVNFPLSIDGIEFSALFIEKDGMIRISFRSKGYFNTNEFARANFMGGGHKNASGGKSDDSLEDTVERFKKLLVDYKSQLLNESSLRTK